MYIAKTTVENRLLIEYAYGTGTKNMSMTMSAIFDSITHDLTIDTKKKIKHLNNAVASNSTRKSMTFPLFDKEKLTTPQDYAIALNRLQNLNTYHVVELQGTSEWFLCRYNLLTSSADCRVRTRST